MSILQTMIVAENRSIEEIAAWLDAQDPKVRQEEVGSLDKAAQVRLWEIASHEGLDLDYMVPSQVEPMHQVRHFGRNSMPAFRYFEKRFCRPPEGQDQGMLWGYNESPAAPLVGPGHFVCRATPGDPRGPVVIDYYRVPPSRPRPWPPLRGNEHGVSRFVYGFMHDFLRRVSAHVTIGRAYRKGRKSSNYFVLCRDSAAD